MEQEATPGPERTESPAAANGESPATGSTRRGLLAGAGLAGIAGVVAACGGADDAAGGAQENPGSGTGSGAADAGGAVLAKTSEIPVGGGKVFAEQKIVVTQPAQGTFKAFSATCTHRGCTVGSVADGTIRCPCHGSRFSINDAAVTGGPASRSLPAKEIVVEGDQIRLA